MDKESVPELIFDHYMRYRREQVESCGRTRGTMGSKCKALEVLLLDLGYRIKKVSGNAYWGGEYELEDMRGE